jgi:phosphohistidine phosphatase
MIIYFLRHASAGQKRANAKHDDKRPLDKQGIEQCRFIGRALGEADAQVDAIISSPLKRATQTASLVGTEMGYEGDVRIDAALRPDAEYEIFRGMLHGLAKMDAIMVVGHNPSLAEFLGALLTNGAETEVVDLKKGAVARVEYSGKDSAVLNWCLTPKLVKALQASTASKSLPKTVRK